MSRFNTTKETEILTNYMGGRAYKQSPKEELAFAVLTSFFDNKYYESSDDRISRISELVAKVAKKDPEFVAKLAVFARTKFNMRSAFPVLIGEFAKVHKGDSLVRDAIVAGATRVDDLTEIVSYIGPKNLSTRVKKGIGKALGKFDEYQFAKYKGGNKEISLVDVVNLVHPKPTEKNASALKALIDGTLKSADTWEVKKSAGGDTAEVFNELLDNNKLGYMALLRNLRNIVKTGDSALINKAAKVISDPVKVAKSKQLPFRFLSAYSALEQFDDGGDGIKFEKDTDGVATLQQALVEAITSSVANIPLLEGKTLILSDNSGSMHGDRGGSSVISANSNVKTASIANLFAALYWLRADNTSVGLFGDQLISPKLDRTKDVFDNYRIIDKAAHQCGYSTEQGLFTAFQNLVKNKTHVDRIVIFSDCQVGTDCRWFGESTKAPDFDKLLTQYKKLVNSDVKVYSVDLQGYGKPMTKDGNTMKLTGWSEKIFDIMEKNEIAPGAFVKEIEKISLTAPVKPTVGPNVSPTA